VIAVPRARFRRADNPAQGFFIRRRVFNMSAKATTAARATSNLVWQLVEKLDEQRRHPRVPLAAHASLSTAAGGSVDATVINVSPDGMQLRCDVAAARVLRPGSGRGEDAAAEPLHLCLELPVDGASLRFDARAELLYLTTVDSEPRCVFGLRFAPLDARAERHLLAFFTDQLGIGVDDAANA
jgi:hypothetical protein